MVLDSEEVGGRRFKRLKFFIYFSLVVFKVEIVFCLFYGWKYVRILF